jgi:hypothetical protein
VKRAISRQSANGLSVHSQRAMIGTGEVWLSQTCPNAACSSPGAIRIIAVNP